MFAYVVRRLVHAGLVLVLLSLATRGLLSAMPGDPIDHLKKSSPRPLSADDLQRLKRHYGFDDPFLIQYGKWLRQLLTGDLGYSLTHHVPVGDLLWPALGRTLLLTGAAFVLASLLSIWLGVQSASAPGSVNDLVVRLLCYLGISVPPFWLCMVLIQWFAVRWRWLPPDAQMVPGSVEPFAAWSYLVLPVAAVTMILTAEWTRYVRAGLREVLGADFLQALRARGASERRILWLHAVPNALVPFFTIIGLSLPYLVGGELVAETVLAWPGLGQLEYNAVRDQDYNVAMAALLLIAIATLLGSFLADVVHAALDPRVRQQSIK
jgi:peptide/nickel transport system permease protein